MAFNVPYTACVIGMAVFTGFYLVLGGYMASSINDFIQGIIMLVSIAFIIGAVLAGQGVITSYSIHYTKLYDVVYRLDSSKNCF